MSKKKLLSVLIIGLIVFGLTIFVVNNLQAKPKTEFEKCEEYCWQKFLEGYNYGDCVAIYCANKF